jgi:hypothetical protein
VLSQGVRELHGMIFDGTVKWLGLLRMTPQQVLEHALLVRSPQRAYRGVCKVYGVKFDRSVKFMV